MPQRFWVPVTGAEASPLTENQVALLTFPSEMQFSRPEVEQLLEDRFEDLIEEDKSMGGVPEETAAQLLEDLEGIRALSPEVLAQTPQWHLLLESVDWKASRPVELTPDREEMVENLTLLTGLEALSDL